MLRRSLNWRRVLFLPYQGLKGCMRPLGPPTDDTSLLTAAIRCQRVLKSWSSTTVQRRNGWHDFGTLIWPHFGRLIWPHLIYSDRSSYPVPASRDGEGDGQETQGGTV